MNGVGIIYGTVTKAGTGDPVYLVRVKAKAGGVVWDKDKTDDEGEYRLTVPWGQYTVRFIHRNCPCANVEDQVTVSGVPADCNVQLGCP